MFGGKSRSRSGRGRRRDTRRCGSERAAWLRQASTGYGMQQGTRMEEGRRVSHELELVVARLQRQQGVLGAMLVGIDDGMVIAGDAGPGRDSDTAAALAASLFRRTRNASDDAGLGKA